MQPLIFVPILSLRSALRNRTAPSVTALLSNRSFAPSETSRLALFGLHCRFLDRWLSIYS